MVRTRTANYPRQPVTADFGAGQTGAVVLVGEQCGARSEQLVVVDALPDAGEELFDGPLQREPPAAVLARGDEVRASGLP